MLILIGTRHGLLHHCVIYFAVKMTVSLKHYRYPAYGLYRRVNVFIYLNPNWEESFGGHLELW